MDGTLLSHVSHSVPQSAREAIASLQKRGILCIVATGRQLQEMEKLPVGDIPFDGYLMLNGQMTLDGKKRLLRATPIEGHARELLLTAFQEGDFPALLVQEKKVYLNLVNDQVREAQARISSAVPPVGIYEGGEIYQVCVYLKPEEEWKIASIRDACTATRWNGDGLDIVARDGGKEKGIRRFLEDLGISPEQTIAFGDGENDVGMLQAAGIGVAMGNAVDAAKAAADHITADIDDDGIAKALRHFGLIE